MARQTQPTDSLEEQAPVDLNATPARQGMRGLHLLWVLIISLMLAAAALFGSWAFRSNDLSRVEPNNSGSATEAQMFDQNGKARQNYSR